MTNSRSLYVAQAAMIAALYVVLTYVSSALGLWEIRFSEALSILPFFTAAAVPGLTAGCIVATLLTGCAAWDIVFGSLATFLGAVTARRLCKKSWIWAPWPNVIANTIVVPLILQFVYMDTSRTYLGFVAYIALSEIVSGAGLGYVLLHALRPHERIFRL